LSAPTPNVRFREARERLGRSPDELEKRIGINIWDIEAFEDELTCCYSPKEVASFCRALEIVPADLFGAHTGSSVSESDLIGRIHDECQSRGITLEQFEDAVGWRLAQAIESPEGLLGNLTIDGLQWLCCELRIDWRRVLADP
jgi:hypothetical protein